MLYCIALLLVGCHPATPKNDAPPVVSSNTAATSTTPNSISDQTGTPKEIKIDTTTLQGQRQYLLKQFTDDNLGWEYDTLIDLNYDGYPDFVIGFYGQAGNGIKNGVKIYLYNPRQKKYIESEQLSDMANPTFYLRQKKITTFYIAGSGSGSKLEWIKGKWVETKTFKVEHSEEDYTENIVWEIEYPLTGKKDTVMRPFQMIPPTDILESSLNQDQDYTPFH